jgi:hypothetical protein
METIVYAVIMLSAIILVWGTGCLIYSTKVIREEKKQVRRDDTTMY